MHPICHVERASLVASCVLLRSGFESVSYARLIEASAAVAAERSEGEALSGWCASASSLYLRLISAALASTLSPRTA